MFNSCSTGTSPENQLFCIAMLIFQIVSTLFMWTGQAFGIPCPVCTGICSFNPAKACLRHARCRWRFQLLASNEDNEENEIGDLMNFAHETHIACTWHSQYGQKKALTSTSASTSHRLLPVPTFNVESWICYVPWPSTCKPRFFFNVGLTQPCLSISYVFEAFRAGSKVGALGFPNFTSLDIKRATFSASPHHTQCTDWLEHDHYKPRRA